MSDQKIWVLTKTLERSTDMVLEYLFYLGGTFHRIHSDDVVMELDIEIGRQEGTDTIKLKFDKKELKTSYSQRMWYRRGDFSYKIPLNREGLNEDVCSYLIQEWDYVKYFVHKYLSKIGSYYEEFRDNKLMDLFVARNCGLGIPNTLVTTSKEKVKDFHQKYAKIISKPIHNGHLNFIEDGKKYTSKGIVIVNDEIIDKSASSFCLSLFQEYIEKKIEIRVFFYEDKLYAMAIFSQLDEKTKYDYRNYNRQKPNRNVPYRLPKEIEAKLLQFIKESNLSTGSIDLIYSRDNEYYFLEVNPSGQFGWVSSNCNYYIEKRIAEYLLK